jgi:hypothetical protein
LPRLSKYSNTIHVIESRQKIQNWLFSGIFIVVISEHEVKMWNILSTFPISHWIVFEWKKQIVEISYHKKLVLSWMDSKMKNVVIVVFPRPLPSLPSWIQTSRYREMQLHTNDSCLGLHIWTRWSSRQNCWRNYVDWWLTSWRYCLTRISNASPLRCTWRTEANVNTAPCVAGEM